MVGELIEAVSEDNWSVRFTLRRTLVNRLSLMCNSTAVARHLLRQVYVVSDLLARHHAAASPFLPVLPFLCQFFSHMRSLFCPSKQQLSNQVSLLPVYCRRGVRLFCNSRQLSKDEGQFSAGALTLGLTKKGRAVDLSLRRGSMATANVVLTSGSDIRVFFLLN